MRRVQLSPRQFDNIFSSMSEGLIVVDADCRVITMNQAAAIMLHIAPAEAAGKDVGEVFPMFQDDPKKILTCAYIERVVSEYNILHVQFNDNMSARKKTAEAFPIAAEFTPLLEGTSIVGAVIAFRDVTEEKKFAHAKAEFLSLASHQLRSPLAATSWYTELLLSEGAADLKPEQKECLERVYENNQRMIGLVDQLLDISRIELGTFSINTEPRNMEDILKEVFAELAPRAKSKQIVFKNDFVHDLPLMPMDREAAIFVFKNLISYALYAAPRGGIIYSALIKKGENALFSLGDGVPPAEGEAQSLATEMFRVDRDSEGGEIHSTGLELYTVHALTEAAGGEVWICKELSASPETFFHKQNKTTFSIMFPLSGMRERGGVTK